MQRVNEFSFYDLAVKVHPLTEVGEVKLSDKWFEWFQARAELNGIFKLRPLGVSLAAATKLYEAITVFVPVSFDEAVASIPNRAEEEPLLSWQTYAIRSGAIEFETVLAAECQVLDTYFVSKKGVYSTADLIERAHYLNLIPESIRKNLSEQTKFDFDQAGKCMVFDLPTATAYHLLRGTETVIRHYYDEVVAGIKKAPAKARNWGAYIKLLRDHAAEGKVTSLLHHIKESYRNPVLHPEDNYTDEMVQVLFGVCVSAIVMMVQEIARLKAADEKEKAIAALRAAIVTPSLTESTTSFADEVGTGMKIVS